MEYVYDQEIDLRLNDISNVCYSFVFCFVLFYFDSELIYIDVTDNYHVPAINVT